MITLHHVPFSRSFRVMWMLEELGLDYETQSYSIRDGSLRDPGFLAKSPAGRVPALDLGDETMFESAAILQVLAERHPEARLDRPAGDAERVRFLELMGFAETMGSQIESLNMQHLFLRDPATISVTVMKLNTARLRAALKALERMIGDQDYMLPSGVSAADMMMGFNVFAAPFYVKLDEMPRLRAYMARLEARPAYQRARMRDGAQDFYTRDFYPIPDVV